jgi:hypothetical protein
MKSNVVFIEILNIAAKMLIQDGVVHSVILAVKKNSTG